MSAARKRTPLSVIRRLPDYLSLVQDLRKAGIPWVSSHVIAMRLGFTSSTVRQDLTYLDFSGSSKFGYSTDSLGKALCAKLGADARWTMIVIGAGNLGRALALYEGFRRRGFRIRAIFDSDPAKTGSRVGRFTVRHVSEMPAAVRRFRVDVGIIAVPEASAQEVADILVLAGVRGLLNLAPTRVVTPAGVPVIDSRVVASLLELSYAITETGLPGRRSRPRHDEPLRRKKGC